MNIRERLAERRNREGSKPVLVADEVVRVRKFFDDNPDCQDVYLFYGGNIEGGEKFRRRMSSRIEQIEDGKHSPRGLSSRTVQLVSIMTDGIPANIGRGHSQIRC